MKFLKKLVATVLLISTTVAVAEASEDYALTDEYKLLTDMKMAKDQQAKIVEMNRVLEHKNIDLQKVKQSINSFDKVVHGLINGDNNLKLNGTTIPHIRQQLDSLLIAWNRSKSLLSQDLNRLSYKQKALNSLNTLLLEMTQTVERYNQSYSRYKQRSRLSSIVNRHMRTINRTFAFNTIY
jgi:hypothetical protein